MTSDTKHDKTTDLLKAIEADLVAQQRFIDSQEELINKSTGAMRAAMQWQSFYDRLQPSLEAFDNIMNAATRIEKITEPEKRIVEMQNEYNNIYQSLIPSEKQLTEIYIRNLGYSVGQQGLIKKLGKKLRPEIKKKHEGENLSDLEIENILRQEIGDQNTDYLERYSILFARYLHEELKKDKYGGKSFIELFNSGLAEPEKQVAPTFRKDSLMYGAVEAVEKRIRDEQTKADKKANYEARENARVSGEWISTLAGSDGNTNLRGFSDRLEDAFNSFSIVQIKNLNANEIETHFDNTGLLIENFEDERVSAPIALPTNTLQALAKMADEKMGKTCEDPFNPIEPTLTFEVTKFFKQSGKKDIKGNNLISQKQQRANLLIQLFSRYSDLIGTLPNGSAYSVLTFQKYDADTDLITISSPYIFKAVDMAHRYEGELEKPQFNNLLHASIALEQNTAAIEVANFILNGLLKRGKTQPILDRKGRKCILYDVKYSTIVGKCPQVKMKLEEIDRRKGTITEDGHEYPVTIMKNQILKTTFRTAYRIIKERSDATKEFNDLSLDGVKFSNLDISRAKYPTCSTLNSKINITHYPKI